MSEISPNSRILWRFSSVQHPSQQLPKLGPKGWLAIYSSWTCLFYLCGSESRGVRADREAYSAGFPPRHNPLFPLTPAAPLVRWVLFSRPSSLTCPDFHSVLYRLNVLIFDWDLLCLLDPEGSSDLSFANVTGSRRLGFSRWLSGWPFVLLWLS